MIRNIDEEDDTENEESEETNPYDHFLDPATGGEEENP